MALSSASITTAINALTTAAAGGSTTQGRTSIDLTQSFANGTGANQVTSVIDGNVTSNNVARALSTFTDTLGVAFSGLTKLKGFVAINTSAANATTVSCNATGAPSSFELPANGTLVHLAPSAGGITVSGTTTITSNGNAADAVRVILFLA